MHVQHPHEMAPTSDGGRHAPAVCAGRRQQQQRRWHAQQRAAAASERARAHLVAGGLAIVLCGDGARALERSNLAERIGVLFAQSESFAQSGVREQLDPRCLCADV